MYWLGVNIFRTRIFNTQLLWIDNQALNVEIGLLVYFQQNLEVIEIIN
jgi:hypothetical protein